MRIFILEDDPARITAFQFALVNHDLTICKWLGGPDGAIKRFDYSKQYDLILLDHDLGGQVYVNSDEEETGFQFVKHLGKRPESWDPPVVVHSWNPEGAKNMQKLLEENGWSVYLSPFGPTMLDSIVQFLAQQELNGQI